LHAFSGVPEKVGVNKEGVNQKWYSFKKETSINENKPAKVRYTENKRT
jgi:hypothetical protein